MYEGLFFLGLVQIQHLTALELSFSRPKTERNKEKQTDATTHDGDSLSLAEKRKKIVENVNLSESSSLKNTLLISLALCSVVVIRHKGRIPIFEGQKFRTPWTGK
jgi:hypothetical protein